jgi:hypothetical protein
MVDAHIKTCTQRGGTLAGILHLDMYKDAAKEGKGAVRQLAES